MKIKNSKTLFALIGFIFWANITWAQDYVAIPKLERRVTDLTSTLTSSDINSLETKLKSFEETKGSQIAVLIVPTTQPEEIEQYAIRVVDEWKLGREGIDDGVLILVAKGDRKVRVEVGYGLEGAIPDIYAKRIVENIILPDFRNGQFDAGIEEGVNATIDLINGEDLPVVTSNKTNVKRHGSKFGIFGFIIMFVILSFVGQLVKAKWAKVLIAILAAVLIAWIISSIAIGLVSLVVSIFALFGKSGRGGGGGYYGGGRYYGGGSSFGGGSSGGFGGFSGGGGGFGGGGASGGW